MKRIGWIVLAASAAMAQVVPAPRTPSELKTYLNLTDAQIASLQQIQQQHRDSARTTAENLAQKARTLREQVSAGSADAAALGRQLIEIEGLRKQLNDSRTRFQTQAAAVLTPDQRTKLKALDDAAKLREEIGQAVRLGLLAPPEPAGGPWMGGRGGMGAFGGPGMFGGQGMPGMRRQFAPRHF